MSDELEDYLRRLIGRTMRALHCDEYSARRHLIAEYEARREALSGDRVRRQAGEMALDIVVDLLLDPILPQLFSKARARQVVRSIAARARARSLLRRVGARDHPPHDSGWGVDPPTGPARSVTGSQHGGTGAA
jgi:hypothetical protein